MIEPVWQAVKVELSGEKAKEFTARLWSHARWNTFSEMDRTATEIAAIMQEIGLEGVEIIRYPADGVTAYGGWVMPQAWDVEEATLEVAEPEAASVLANYRECPMCLMMYSAPTPPEGIVAEVVALDKAGVAASYEGIDVRGKILLVDSPWIDTSLLAFERGAVGLVCDAMKLAGGPQDKGGGHFDHAFQWNNYAIPPWRWEGEAPAEPSSRKKGFGFSISPADGRRLRESLRSGATVRLRGIVRSRLYDGTLPLVTGLLRGDTSDEIVLTGHLCEPGANDNSSGCALGLEVVRTIRALRSQGKLPGLKRGLRPVFSFEVRGYQAFLANYPHLRRFVAGINMDMVGNDLSDARSAANLIFNWPNLPAYTDFLALELLRRLQREDPLFRFRVHEAGGLVDNLFGEPSVGAPMCVLGAWPDSYYHTSLDRLENISPKALALFGRVAATFCTFLANAGFAEATWLAQLVASHAEEQLLCHGRLARSAVRRTGQASRGTSADQAAAEEKIERLVRKGIDRLQSLRRLVRGRGFIPTAEGLDANKDWLCSWSHLFQDEELNAHLEKLGDRLRDSAARLSKDLGSDRRYAQRLVAPKGRRIGEGEAPWEGEAPAEPSRVCATVDLSDRAGQSTAGQASRGTVEPEEACARRLVPVRTFRGSLCFESLDEGAREELRRETGLTVGWGAPHWLHLALFQSNGKRTAWDIWQWLSGEGGGTTLDTLNRTLEFLARHGFVRLRPVLGQDDFRKAFEAVGLPRGAVAMVHSSLSQFGYVVPPGEGEAPAEPSRLCATVGLSDRAVPGTGSTAGQASRGTGHRSRVVPSGADTVIGALLDALGPDGTLCMPTLTFSWVGRPPYDPRTSPSRVGAITEAFRQRPGVLRSGHPTHSVTAFGPKAQEIVAHHPPDQPVFAADSPYGKLYDLDAWVLMLAKIAANTCLHMAEERAGIPLVDIEVHVMEGGRRRKLRESRAPWHANFEEHHKVLFARQLIRSAPLGEGTIYLMRVRDAVDTALENIRQNPRLVMTEGCQCDFCRRFRAQLEAGGEPKSTGG